MIEIANQVVQSLFKKNSLQECSRWELEILADKYPYFGIAQLLVSGKLKEENAAEYEKQVQKTSLYFTNPLWLDYVLNKNPLPPELKIAPATDHAPEAFTTAEETITEIVEAPVAGDTYGQAATEEESLITKTETTTGQPTEDVPVEQVAEIIETPSAGNYEQVETELPVSAANTESAIVETKEDIPVTGSDTGTDLSDQTTNEQIRIAPLKPEPMPDADATLTFEPYHTVDYFASQGIKLSQDEKPQDRFGQQLKSFTQWLKTIKKIPPAEIAKELGKGNEQKVVTLAEHSLDDREIVTETMAEVWVKQGNMEKAIAVYNKLSLQNPAKSAYFAGLIEQLKQH